MELVIEESVDVIVLRDGGPEGPDLPPYIPRIASVCATHADGSIGRTGSWRGIVK